MSEALLWGLVAGASFLAGGAADLRGVASHVRLGVIMAFGAGALISAVAYELVDEAGRLAGATGRVAVGLLIGGLIYVAVTGRTAPLDHQRSLVWRDALGPVVGVVPEAIIIVGSLLTGHGVNVAVIAAVFLCGVPEAMGETARWRERGGDGRRIMWVWAGWMVVCGVTAAVAYPVLDAASDSALAFTLSVAAGIILADLTGDLVPEAHRLAGARAGLALVGGFALSFGLVGLG